MAPSQIISFRNFISKKFLQNVDRPKRSLYATSDAGSDRCCDCWPSNRAQATLIFCKYIKEIYSYVRLRYFTIINQ